MTAALATLNTYCPGIWDSDPIEKNVSTCSPFCTGACIIYVYTPDKGKCRQGVTGNTGCQETQVDGQKQPYTGYCGDGLGSCACNGPFTPSGNPVPVSYVAHNVFPCGS